MGKSSGTANARIPFKVLWIIHIRILRRILKKIRYQKKIDNHIYHYLYVLAEGNQFKNKQVLLKSIHDIKAVRDRERFLKEQAEVRKGRYLTILDRKASRE